MNNSEHPITPPDELVQQWLCDDNYPCDSHTNSTISIAAGRLRNIATQAARWGADQEMEACISWISKQPWTWTSSQLRAVRRPKPPSLREQALKVLFEADGADHPTPILVLSSKDATVIRRALEALPE